MVAPAGATEGHSVDPLPCGGICCPNDKLLCTVDNECVSCFDLGETCNIDTECCAGTECLDDGTCGVPCITEGDNGCSTGGTCCDGLICNSAGNCVTCFPDESGDVCSSDSQCCGDICHIADFSCEPCNVNRGDTCSRDKECCSDNNLLCDEVKNECCGSFFYPCTADEECCPEIPYCTDLDYFGYIGVIPQGLHTCFFCKSPGEDCTQNLDCCGGLDSPLENGVCNQGKCCSATQDYTCKSSSDCCDPTDRCFIPVLFFPEYIGICDHCITEGECQADYCCDGYSCDDGFCQEIVLP
jgi:hypothetical protein